jgi:type I restriction enzyme S subunit
MTNDWVEKEIDNVAEVIGGGTPSTKDESNFGGDIAWITPKDLSGYSSRYISRGERNITEKGLRNSSARLLPKGSVLLTTRAPVGYLAISANPVTTNQGFHSLVPKTGYDAEFIYYLLKANVEVLKGHSTGTTFGELTGSVLRRLRFCFPAYKEQRAIAHILGTLDDKIELNRQMNATLEAIARALFKSWFVDLDPVRAKAEGRQPAGMDAETAALFPAAFVDSELGKIPKGWRVQRLEQHLDAVKGLSYSGSGLSENLGMPMHNLNSIYEGGGYKFEGIKFYIGDYKEHHLLYPGDIIVANTEQGFDYLLIGYPAIVPKHFGNEGIFSHHLFRVRPIPGSPLTTHFIYHLLMTPLVREQVVACTNGTTVNMLNVDGLRTPRFILPSAALIQSFESIVAPMFTKVEENYKESLSLAALRDALLPKLISGEIRIKDAEKLVGERL